MNNPPARRDKTEGSDVDPDWLYPDPDPNPDPGRIQVHKISKFSKHLLIFESKKKTFNFQVTLHLLFKGSELKHIISCENKDFCWLNSAFPFIFSVILCLWIRIRIRNPDPDPDPQTQMNPDPDPHHCFKPMHKCFMRFYHVLKCFYTVWECCLVYTDKECFSLC